MTEIAAENNATTLFPIPIDMFGPFLDRILGSRTKREEEPAGGDGRPLLEAPRPDTGAPGTKVEPEPVNATQEKLQPR